MKNWAIPLTVSIIAIVAIGLGASVSQDILYKNPFEATDLFQIGITKPAIWIYYDTSVLNSRNYSDFGSRSSRALNLPFMNLCYESIAKHNTNVMFRTWRS